MAISAEAQHLNIGDIRMPEINGVEVTDEQFAAIEAHTAKLVQNRDDILTEKKQAMEALELKDQAIKDKQTALQQAEEDKLKLSGDMEGLKAHYEKQNAAQIAELSSASDMYKNALLDRDKQVIKGNILDKVEPGFKEMASAMLELVSTVSFNDAGEVVKEFKTGDGVVSNEADFLSWASENSESWQRMLTGANSTGAGTGHSSGGSYASSLNRSSMSAQDKMDYASKHGQEAFLKLPK